MSLFKYSLYFILFTLCFSAFYSFAQNNCERPFKRNTAKNEETKPRAKSEETKPKVQTNQKITLIREFEEVRENLQKIKADPRSTHVPYFSNQIEKTLTDFEERLTTINSADRKFLGKRLKLLERFKKEALKRIETQEVTYDWWANFNLRLNFLSMPEEWYVDYSVGLEGVHHFATHESTENLLVSSFLYHSMGPSSRRSLEEFMEIRTMFPEIVMFFSTNEFLIVSRSGIHTYLVGKPGEKSVWRKVK